MNVALADAVRVRMSLNIHFIFSLAIAQKTYRARNDKELSVQPGEFFEVSSDFATIFSGWSYLRNIYLNYKEPVCNLFDGPAQWC